MSLSSDPAPSGASSLPTPPAAPSILSNFIMTSTERDPDSDLAHDPMEMNIDADESEEAVHFVLLAEFDIDAGATLAHQYPYPTGTDEHRLAELMLPDGAHLRPEDWTVFYLGQTPSSAVDPMLSHEVQSPSSSRARPVSMASSTNRTSIVDSLPAGEKPKRGVAGGGLLYVLNCVRMKEDKSVRRGAMVKALAICSPNPYIGIYKPLLLLALEEYFVTQSPDILARLYDSANSISTSHMPTLSRNERILLRHTERKDLFEEKFVPPPSPGQREFFEEESESSMSSHRRGHASISSAGGTQPPMPTRKDSATSNQLHVSIPTSIEGGGGLPPDMNGTEARRKGVSRDTHFFETEARFKKITVPIRIPLTVFDEDVGDYSIIELVQAFSSPHTFPPPFHPYLHTNGPSTHPVILILNALLANKRVLFLGYGLPANQVARMVLAACALVSGSGQILPGATESAFPYANLASLDILEEFSGYVAGVTNPRFEELPGTWDVLCNLETGKVAVSKHLTSTTASYANMKSGRSSETSLSASIVKVDDDPQAGTPAAKMSAQGRADCVDNQFMEDIQSAMAGHYGESHVRQRFTDYISRFTRLASYHEFSQTGQTKIGYPTIGYRDGQLGSGTVFSDESAKSREMRSNVHRIEAWRKTKSYKLYAKQFAKGQNSRAMRDFDVQHQIARLRLGRNMSDGEAEAVFSALAEGVKSYEQVVELLTYLPAHWGGLMPIANGLFHRWPGVREAAIELLSNLQQYLIGRQAFATMNYFHRKTYLQLLEQRETALLQQRQRMDQLRWDRHRTSIANDSDVGATDLASPGTVLGNSDAVTPQALARA